MGHRGFPHRCLCLSDLGMSIQEDGCPGSVQGRIVCLCPVAAREHRDGIQRQQLREAGGGTPSPWAPTGLSEPEGDS